jgi:hypothetical protein
MFSRFHGPIISRRCFLAVFGMLSAASFAEPISRVPVESSNLRSVGFDAKKLVLEVQFHHGGIYRYFDVPAATHEALMKSESKGKFFQSSIRNKFRFERVSSGK